MSYSTRVDYTLHLADNALILGHRNSEWTGHGPILEQDIALSNIALDLIGQARNFYQYAARLINTEREAKSGSGMRSAAGQGAKGAAGQGMSDAASEGMRAAEHEVSEDSLAYLRDGWDFKNCLLAEQANGDWARTILRQFFISAYQYLLYTTLRDSRDTELAAIAEKSLKEVSYHLRWSSEWVIRLGDGTPESSSRLQKALDDLWKFTGELFLPASYERELAKEGIAADLSLLKEQWETRVREVFAEAQLFVPGGAEAREGGRETRGVGSGEDGKSAGGREGGVNSEGKGGRETRGVGSGEDGKRAGKGAIPGTDRATWMQMGGKEGRHTEHLGYVLAEMQFLQRAYPGCEW
jgi:ring-1,2-phenylacetyl-CoA epoxidase subunit PaaC